MKRSYIKRGTSQLKRTPLKKVGKTGKANLKANKSLNDKLPKEYCELRLNGCLVNWLLQYAHRHKRSWYKGDAELLSDINQVIVACQNCHEKIEHDEKLTEEVFNKLRD
jgi:hypothetical protein